MNEIFVYDTLLNKKVEFLPNEPGKVKMYVCGITPYDECHLGHARCYTVFDVIRRYLEFREYEVTYVQNFTDIDDKIIDRSKKLGVNSRDLTEKYIKKYFLYCERLNIKPANIYPKVTEHIPEIISMIEKLLEKDYAYVKEGDVYFSVRKFKSYGKLSNRSIDDLLVGARVEPDEKKNDPLDFALWKESDSDEPHWDSPWGKGRPGWHIECSVMSTKYLGDTLDIHGGGQDLIFPHHENEIAQIEPITNKPFSKYWLHNGFVTINKEKMSKSLGNFFTLKEIFEKYPPMVVRLFLISQHYMTPVDFSDDRLTQAQNAWSGLVDVYELIWFVFWKNKKTQLLSDIKESSKNFRKDKEINKPALSCINEVMNEFEQAMDDDFNTEKALSVIFQLKSLIYEKSNRKDLDWLKQALFTLYVLVEEILGLIFPKPIYSDKLNNDLVDKLGFREKMRKNKEWAKADEIRQLIENKGYLIEDTIYGPRLKYKT